MATASVWGVQLIDEALGAMPNGFPVLVSGAEGSGRTTLAVQLTDATLRRGGRVVMVTSHPAELVLHRAATMGLDWQTELRMDQLMLFGLEAPARIEAGAYARLLREQLEAACERPSLVIFDGLAPLRARADAPDLESCVETVFSYGGPSTRRVAFVDAKLHGRFGSALHAVASASIRLEGRPGVRKLVVEYQRFGPTLPGPVPYDILAQGLVPDGLVAADEDLVLAALPAPPVAEPRREPEVRAAVEPTAMMQTGAEESVSGASALDDTPMPLPPADRFRPRGAPEVAQEILAANADEVENVPARAADESAAPTAEESTDPLETTQVDLDGEPSAPAEGDGSRPNILVISNQHENWRSLRSDLDHVFQMKFVEPDEGRDLPARAEDCDAVVVDAVSMSGESEDLLSMLRDRGVRCPILAVTNRHRRSFDRVVTLLRGADDLLPWPPGPGKLRQRLETAIRNRAEGRGTIDRSASELLPRTTGWRLLDEGSFLELVQRGNRLSAELNLSSSVLSIVASDLSLVSPLIEVIEEELRDSDVLHLVDGGRVLVYLPLTAPDDLKPVLQRLSEGLRGASIEPLAFRISAHAGDETSRERLASTLGLATDRADDADYPVVLGERDEDADLPSAVAPDEDPTS